MLLGPAGIFPAMYEAARRSAEAAKIPPMPGGEGAMLDLLIDLAIMASWVAVVCGLFAGTIAGALMARRLL